MSRLLGIVAVVLSAAALAVAWFRVPGPAEDQDFSAEVEGLDPERSSLAGEGADRDARLAALESTVSHLVRRVSALERAAASQPVAAAGTGAALPPAERDQLSALRSDVDALLTGAPLESEEARGRLKEMVRDLQDEMFAERAQQRAAAREQRQTERLQKFIEEARLSSTQAQDITRLLDEEGQRRRALVEQRRAMREQGAGGPGGRPQQGPSEMRALRQQTDENARRILDAAQFEQYQQMRQGERRGAGGGRRGGQGAR